MLMMLYGDSDGIMIALIIVVSVVRPEVIVTAARGVWPDGSAGVHYPGCA